MMLPEWIEVILLGIIEGVTEFLPISSTGHLLLAQQWMKPQSDLFNTVIQCGAVLAVLLIFTQRLKQMLWQWRDPATQDYMVKLAAAFGITAVGGLFMKKFDFELPETATPVALSVLIGGILIIVIEKWLRGKPRDQQITWTIAIVIGLAQLAAALFPGLSRSGATILAALIMGLSRPLATEFSFLLGIPTLFAAGAVQIYSGLTEPDAPSEDWGLLLLGTVVAAVTAFIAVKWLLRFVQTHTFISFGWYRIALGVLILGLMAL